MLFNKKYTKALSKVESECDFELWENGELRLYILRKRVTRRTIIHLEESGDIVWEQLYPFGGMSNPRREKRIVLKPASQGKPKTAVLYRGTPLLIRGLDNGRFASKPERLKDGAVLFMSLRAYKREFL